MRLSFRHFRGAVTAAAASGAIALLAGCGGGGSGPQALPATGTSGGGSTATAPTSPETIASLVVSPGDTAAAQTTSSAKRHILRALTAAPVKTQSATPTIQYLEDLASAGGRVLTNVTEHDVYISVDGSAPTASTWGNPHQFLADLGLSSFVHVTDQYTKTSGKYAPGGSLTVSNPNYGFAPLYDNDIYAIVHAAAKVLKQPGETGYERIYNLFFPPGVDICATFSTECYSPDNPATFSFCAYHESLDFADIGHVVLTVEPYQAALTLFNGKLVPGCSAQDPKAKDFLQSATDSSLSHETFESITDPDPPTGWTVPVSSGGVAGGYEIGDLCAYAPIEASTLNGTTYAIQPEYSNLVHACVNDNITSAASTQRVLRNEVH